MDSKLEEQLYDVLDKKFGYSTFRPGQLEAITAAMSEHHSLVMLPTGTGKSLCYQLPSYFMSGTTLIVSPLLSLMEDQVETMKKNGEKSVVALNSFMTHKEKHLVIKKLNSFKFIFISPEMLQQERVMDRFKVMDISLLVVDEAHCISQWGMDFRPDYLKLGDIRRELNDPLTMALTATAVEAVRTEIISNLNLQSEIKQVIYSVNRPSIQLRVERCHGNKESRLFDAINTFDGAGIIYFSSKKSADAVAEKIRNTTSFTAESYHSDVEVEDKKKIQAQFLDNELDIICATSAFGMGIDKPDIRYVIHYHMPANPEMYLQEIGRASRDKRGGIALLLYEAGDEHLQARLQSDTLPDKQELAFAYAHPEKLAKLKDNTKVRIANYFMEQKTNLDHAYRMIENRNVYKRQQLKVMVDYAVTTKCKRETLLNYFSEKIDKPLEFCCSSCQSELTLVHTPDRPEKQVRGDSEQRWELIMNKLFNFDRQPKN